MKMDPKRTDQYDIKIPSFKDELTIINEKPIDVQKAEFNIFITQYKSIFAMVIIGLFSIIGIIGFLYFPEESKKYAASISLLNLILGSVVGYLYGNSEKIN